jgi:hypothetical protein
VIRRRSISRPSRRNEYENSYDWPPKVGRSQPAFSVSEFALPANVCDAVRALCRLMSAEQKQQLLDEASAAMQGVPDAIQLPNSGFSPKPVRPGAGYRQSGCALDPSSSISRIRHPNTPSASAKDGRTVPRLQPIVLLN